MVTSMCRDRHSVNWQLGKSSDLHSGEYVHLAPKLSRFRFYDNDVQEANFRVYVNYNHRPIERMEEDEDDSVVVIKVGEAIVLTSYKALRKASKYFEHSIKSTAPIIVVKVDGVALETFECIERYLRTGTKESLELDVENVVDVYSAAAALEMDEIAAECQLFILVICQIEDQALIYYVECLRNKEDLDFILKYIAKDLNNISKSKGFSALKFPTIKKLMTCPQMGSVPARDRFLAISRWLQYDCTSRKKFAPELLANFDLKEGLCTTSICPEISRQLGVPTKGRGKDNSDESFPSMVAGDGQRMSATAPKRSSKSAKGAKGQADSSSSDSDEDGKIARRIKSKGPKSKGPKSKGPKSKGPKSKGPKSKGPKSKGPKSKGPKSKGPKSKGPRSKGPRSKGPRSKGPKSKGPKTKGPKTKGPKSRAAKTKGPKSRGAKSKGPKSRAAKSKGPKSRAAKSKGPKSRAAKSRGAKSRGIKSRGAKSRRSRSEMSDSDSPRSDGRLNARGVRMRGEKSRGAKSRGPKSRAAKSRGAKSRGAKSGRRLVSSPSGFSLVSEGHKSKRKKGKKKKKKKKRKSASSEGGD